MAPGARPPKPSAAGPPTRPGGHRGHGQGERRAGGGAPAAAPRSHSQAGSALIYHGRRALSAAPGESSLGNYLLCR